MCRNSSPPPATPQGCWSWRSGHYFCSPFPPSHSLRTCVAGGGLSGQRIRPRISAGSWGPKNLLRSWNLRFLGAQVGRGNLATCPFDPLPSQWSPNFPFQVWDPFPSHSCPSGVPVLSCLHFSSFTPPRPHVLPSCWGFLPVPLGVCGTPLVPGRCTSCVET